MAAAERIEPDAEVVARLGATALALPDAFEEEAWTGVRWRIRGRTFAHVMVAQTGYESSFRDLTGVADPTTVLTFHATGDELLALVHAGMPFYKPPWSPTIVGMVLDDDTDWAEVADLVTESYRLRAPKRLVRLLEEPPARGVEPESGADPVRSLGDRPCAPGPRHHHHPQTQDTVELEATRDTEDVAEAQLLDARHACSVEADPLTGV
jgi:hypothetical protein